MQHLSWNEVRDRAITFAKVHADDTSEAAEKQTFWNEFFTIFGLRRASIASFEENVRNLKGNKGSIDLLWRGKLLVEHKSRGEDLSYAETQAFTYIEDLTRANRWEDVPRYVLVSDFDKFVLYDLEPDEQLNLPLFAGRRMETYEFSLSELPLVRNLKLFQFMFGPTRTVRAEDPANEKAYDRICELHDKLRAGGFDGHDLERLLVRILFCMFAEDTLIFQPDVFTHFIRTQTDADGSDLGAKLNELFDWLHDPRADKVHDELDPFFGFRYVNGGLFEKPLRFARFNRDMREKLLFCCDFLWERISPAMFGSLFQGVLDDKSRRQQGAHYTSERDIMKVIRSLFLDELHAELNRRMEDTSTRRRAELEAFHKRLRSLNFLDPACGCGNFLVLAYRELRALELAVVSELHVKKHGTEQHAQQTFKTEEFSKLIGVNVDQFHGIEYSEWPVRIAEVALWLMDHQMNQEAGKVFGQSIDRLPLKTSPHIVPGNALQKDWNEVLPREKCSYVLGNPPFIGKHYQNAEQRADMAQVWSDVKSAGDLDYVTCWYLRAAQYLSSSRREEAQTSAPATFSTPNSQSLLTSAATSLPRVAFVSTNSITQGEQVPVLWNVLFKRYHLKIHFAHRTFAWASEARGKAHVHVVIIGFGLGERADKRIHDYDADPENPAVTTVANISPYLTPGPDTFVMKQRQPFGGVPEMRCGNKPTDDGNFILTDAEKTEFLRAEPEAKKYLRRFTGSEEFINGNMRWCLWLKDAAPGDLRRLPKVMERVERIREFRTRSTAKPTQQAAATPTLFFYISQPDETFIAIPEVSSERRPYIPIGFLDPKIIVSNKIYVIPSPDLFLFGILSSVMHMAWVRTISGRLKSDFQYSGSMVYNTFPWPTPTPEQRAKVEDKTRAVLAAREPHLPPRGLNTLADLYDPLTMQPALAKAHAELDRAVERCYRPEPFRSDRERVEHLFRLYEHLTAPLLPASPKTKTRRSPALKTAPRPGKPRTPGLSEAEG